MTLEGSDNDDSGPYGPIGINASGGDGSHANLGWENEVESEDLSNGKDIDYLDSSDVGSYETNSNGDFISKKIVKVFFDPSTVVPRFELRMIFENHNHLKDALYAYDVAHRIIPKLKLSQMMKLGREELNVKLNKQCVMRAKKWATEKISGSVVHEFSELFDYFYALRIVDPEDTFDLIVMRPNNVDNPKHRRLYFCFSALKEYFKKYCKHVLGLDGCYLKWAFKGDIMSTMGRDNNNQIFLIAWTVVEVENNETWAWFLNHL
ncbi:hypothetical protein V6N11_064881 [Hibiscus sabdariffa]|uniref:MULE transposase domain-containing protein n=2 Tax=Hibiscus sabdariffa TaxID=183260 RepID=A0ABR2SIY2_9ROSI